MGKGTPGAAISNAMALDLPLTAIRVRQRMDEIGISQGHLAEAVGATQAAISQILTGATRNSRLLPKIAAQLAVNLDWVLGITDDKIDMFDADGESVSENTLSAIRAGHISNRLLHPDQVTKNSASDKRLAFKGAPLERDPDLVELDQVDLRYGMGGSYLDGPDVASKRAFSRALLRHLTPVPPENLFWALGDGDSMEPTIRSGDLILIDRSQQAPRMGDGIWAVAWGDIGMIKRLRPLPDGSVEIHSDNPLIPPAKAVDGELHVIGRVVAVVRRL
jgi:transcriptional regulator with XRE-family HTH domain